MGYSDFVRAGFPVISVIFFLICYLLVLFSSRASPLFGNGQAKAGGLPVLVCCVYLFLLSCVMIFAGPSRTARNAIQLFVVSCSGTFSVLSGHTFVHLFFILFSIYAFLCALGVMPLFGFDEIISQITTAQCNQYLGVVNAKVCSDNGYLMFIRVVSAIGLYILAISTFLSAMAYGSYGAYNLQPAGGASVSPNPKDNRVFTTTVPESRYPEQFSEYPSENQLSQRNLASVTANPDPALF